MIRPLVLVRMWTVFGLASVAHHTDQRFDVINARYTVSIYDPWLPHHVCDRGLGVLYPSTQHAERTFFFITALPF